MINGDVLMAIGRISCCVAIGFAAGFSAVYVFNRIPAGWLCDYDQEPTEEMWGKRIKKYPQSLIFTAFFIWAAIQMDGQGTIYQIAAIPALWLLLMIGLADKKFMIIPDQFVLGLAVISIGFIPSQSTLFSPLLGALTGAGSLFIIGAAGRFIMKKEAMGFGDVKLMGAIGLIAGLKGTLIILILTFLASGLIMGIMLLSKLIKKEDEQPLGPFIASSAWAYIVFRPWFLSGVDWYLGLY